MNLLLLFNTKESFIHKGAFSACLELETSTWAGGFSGSALGRKNLLFQCCPLPLVTNGVTTATGRFTPEFASELQIFSFPFLLQGACCFKCLVYGGFFQVLKDYEKDMWDDSWDSILVWWSCKSTTSLLNTLWMQSLVTALWCLILCWNTASAHLLRDVPGWALPCVFLGSLHSAERKQKLDFLFHHKQEKLLNCEVILRVVSFLPQIWVFT